jgi:hypothetical protein
MKVEIQTTISTNTTDYPDARLVVISAAEIHADEEHGAVCRIVLTSNEGARIISAEIDLIASLLATAGVESFDQLQGRLVFEAEAGNQQRVLANPFTDQAVIVPEGTVVPSGD